jgi:hypothetical protein
VMPPASAMVENLLGGQWWGMKTRVGSRGDRNEGRVGRAR